MTADRCSPEKLHVFLGQAGGSLIADRPEEIPVSMPQDERHMWLVHLNDDAKQDLLIYHPSEEEPHRVSLLVAN